MDIKKLIDVILTSLNDGKATNIDVYDIKKMTSMSDYMLIASGRSRRQVSALAENLIQTVKKQNVYYGNFKPYRIITMDSRSATESINIAAVKNPRLWNFMINRIYIISKKSKNICPEFKRLFISMMIMCVISIWFFKRKPNYISVRYQCRN